MAQEHRRGRKAEYTDRPLTEDNLMDEFDRDNQRKILELLIVGYSQKEIRKLLEINLYRWKKLMTDTKVLVEKYLDEYYND